MDFFYLTSFLPYTVYKINKKNHKLFTRLIPIFTGPNQFLLDLSDSPTYFTDTANTYAGYAVSHILFLTESGVSKKWWP